MMRGVGVRYLYLEWSYHSRLHGLEHYLMQNTVWHGTVKSNAS